MSKSPDGKTPMLEQFMAIKGKYPDAVMFYRMGDFFELFYDDAKIASEVLGLRLTSRAHGKAAKVPLAGFPHHQIDNYLTKMVEAGHRVVIVEQVEDPKKAKGLVKRDVVRIVTAGTNPAVVDRDDVGVIRISAQIRAGDRFGYAWANVGTGEFASGEFNLDELKLIDGHIDPVEMVVPESSTDFVLRYEPGKKQPQISRLVDWVWEPTFARKTLTDHFGTVGLKGFGINEMSLAISAAGALLYYMKGNLKTDSDHITSLSRASVSNRLYMEASTIRNLELVESLSGNSGATLFSVIDRSITQPGRRLLYNRLLDPLAEVDQINNRLELVEELFSDHSLRKEIRALFKRTGDLQRYLARLATGRGSARDLVGIRETQELLPEFITLISGTDATNLNGITESIDILKDLVNLLSEAIVNEPPLSTTDGGMIKDGYNSEIDELRRIRDSGREWVENFEREQRTATGINNLKVGFNRVFGYYIEITKSQLEKVPDYYTRRQTLVSAERFITAELKEYEDKLLGAEEKVNVLENELYIELVNRTLEHSSEIQQNAKALAKLDVIAGLAELAVEDGYCRPQMENSQDMQLVECRHPVVEKLLPPGEQFVSNDVEFNAEDLRIFIITGPNMAGKSTYLRQVALCVILAQMGSFVPAKSARIGVVDKLFTRIGALDNLAGGESTFLVEMHETASILNNATSHSLVLFDEVGRGTSTFDGLSLAWAIVEYLHEAVRLKPRTLFATHFHEMVELEKYLPSVNNRNVAVREYGDKVIFLRKIINGGCDRSFGIHVAKMAGLPEEVIKRAHEVLINLEANDLDPTQRNGDEKNKPDENRAEVLQKTKGRPQRHIAQLSLFDPIERKIRELLEDVDPNNLTPIEALNLIAELKKII